VVAVRCLLPLVLLAFLGCTQAKRLDIELSNPTEVPLEITAVVGPFQKTVLLMPYGSWVGWVPVMEGVKAKIIIQRKIFLPVSAERPTR
jgi:hypothetical protein